MPAKNKKFILTVPENIKADAINVKRDLFNDKSYSEMYRQLIRMGLDSLKTAKEKQREKSP